jgi:hypothetical protein
MSRALYLPDDLYQRLVEVAHGRGQSADDLLRAILTDAIVHENAGTAQLPDEHEPREDPLAQFIGAFHFGVGDLAARHDAYLTAAYEHHTRVSRLPRP